MKKVQSPNILDWDKVEYRQNYQDSMCIEFSPTHAKEHAWWSKGSGYPLHRKKQGKRGKWQKQIPVRENAGNLEILLMVIHRETQGFLSAKVLNSLIRKVKDIVIFAAKISIFFSRSWIGLFCVCNSHKLCKLTQGKFVVGQGKTGKTQGI